MNGKKEWNVLFNDALNTFYLCLYGVRHMLKDHSDSKMCVCVFECVCVCLCVCGCLCACMCFCIWMCVYVCITSFMHPCLHMYVPWSLRCLFKPLTVVCFTLYRIRRGLSSRMAMSPSQALETPLRLTVNQPTRLGSFPLTTRREKALPNLAKTSNFAKGHWYDYHQF